MLAALRRAKMCWAESRLWENGMVTPYTALRYASGVFRCIAQRRTLLVLALPALAIVPFAALATTTLSCALDYSYANEPLVQPPLSIDYPVHGPASIAGQGSNPSWTPYTVQVATISGDISTNFGVLDSDSGEGVPWDDPNGLLTDGFVKAFAIDVGLNSSYKITITFQLPVMGVRFAITDLDLGSESALVQAFPNAVGGSAIVITDNLLSAPTSLPTLAFGSTHATNDAYVVDQNKVNAAGGGLYSVKTSGGTSDRTGTVLLRYGDAQEIQRIEVSYAGSNTGIWIAGLQFIDSPNADDLFYDGFERCPL